MIYAEDGAFLNWIANRIVYRAGDSEEDWHILYMRDLCHRLKTPSISISDADLDRIIAKYYTDFFLDKTDNIGFSEKERSELRSTIRLITQDILSLNISQPKIGP